METAIKYCYLKNSEKANEVLRNLNSELHSYLPKRALLFELSCDLPISQAFPSNPTSARYMLINNSNSNMAIKYTVFILRS